MVSWVIDGTTVLGIADFTNQTDLCSFMGLVNQVSEFTPKHAKLTAPLRSLLKTSEFTWTANHTTAFNTTKTELVSPWQWDVFTIRFYSRGIPLPGLTAGRTDLDVCVWGGGCL